jgi:4-hydroxy-3-methylbut-2-enyl diphosphate reductase
VIRAHGISPQEKGILEQKGVCIIDATCPRVARVQALIRKHAQKGHFCFIVGDQDHPEVRGLMGFAAAGGIAISCAAEKDLINTVSQNREVAVVAQTTQDEKTFEDVVQILKQRFAQIHVYNTICDSTRKRQAEVGRLSRQSDMIVVVGGRGSGNTRRLVQVAQAQGVEALHVETPEEIPVSAFAGVRMVGVTAGASTPNWQIQRIIYRLKEIGRSRVAGPLRALKRLSDIAIMTYLWAALGGGGLTAACLILQGREVTWLPLAVAMLFVFSMHLLNRILEGAGAVRFSTPETAAFYSGHRGLLTTLGVVSCASSLVLGFHLGLYSFLLLSAMIVAGLSYTAPVVLHPRVRVRRWWSLKDIPGSKTPLVALGWAMAAVVLPVGSELGSLDRSRWPGLAVAFVFAAGSVFWRTALSDLLDIQGDRMVGRETIPILIGVERTDKLLIGLLIFLSALLVVGAWVGWITKVGYWLVLNISMFGVFFLIYQRRHLVDRLSFDGILDGNLLLAAAVSIIYGIARG